MNEKTLVICDKEARYAKGLGDNLSERNEFAFKVYAFTDGQHVLDFVSTHKIDVLLVDESFTQEERKCFQAEQNLAKIWVKMRSKYSNINVRMQFWQKY